eukprot:117810-Amphidinium_carterae.1
MPLQRLPILVMLLICPDHSLVLPHNSQNSHNLLLHSGQHVYHTGSPSAAINAKSDHASSLTKAQALAHQYISSS